MAWRPPDRSITPVNHRGNNLQQPAGNVIARPNFTGSRPGDNLATSWAEWSVQEILRSTMTIAACSQEAPRHRAGMLASLEDGNACRNRRLISIGPLHETAAAGRHVVHELRLVQPQTVEVDDVHVGAQARHQPAAIRHTEEVGGFAGLPLDQMFERQPWPAVTVAAPMRQHVTRHA